MSRLSIEPRPVTGWLPVPWGRTTPYNSSSHLTHIIAPGSTQLLLLNFHHVVSDPILQCAAYISLPSHSDFTQASLFSQQCYKHSSAFWQVSLTENRHCSVRPLLASLISAHSFSLSDIFGKVAGAAAIAAWSWIGVLSVFSCSAAAPVDKIPRSFHIVLRSWPSVVRHRYHVGNSSR